MATKQIIGQRDPLIDNEGALLSGGTIDVFAPGTTTRITSYSDSGLTQENTNPVLISGAGRANIWLGRDADICVNDASGNRVAEELNVNPSNIVSGFNSGLVPNGSFETDTNSDDVPDGWTSDVNETGSNNGLETGVGNTGAGAQSWRTQSSGNGGGELVTTSSFEVNDFDNLRVSFLIRSTVTNVRNIVRVEWYDVSDVLISNSDVYDSTANPATFTQQDFVVAPPAGARLARLRIIGGTTGGILSGITYWDNVRVVYPEPITGAFDNVTIQGNQLITTDTNGNMTLEPNGTGRVFLGGNRTEVLGDTTSAFELRNTADGVSAVDGGLDEGQSVRLRFRNSQDNAVGSFGYAGSRDMTLANDVWQGGINISGANAVGSLRDMLRLDPINANELLHNNAVVMSTTATGIEGGTQRMGFSTQIISGSPHVLLPSEANQVLHTGLAGLIFQLNTGAYSDGDWFILADIQTGTIAALQWGVGVTLGGTAGAGSINLNAAANGPGMGILINVGGGDFWAFRPLA